MIENAGTKKIFPLGLLIIFLSFILLILLVGFKFLSETINDYEKGIQQIAENKTVSFTNDLKILVESAAEKIRQSGASREVINNIAGSDNNISNIILMDSRGYVTYALQESEVVQQQKLYSQLQKDGTFIYSGSGEQFLKSLYAATPVLNKQNELQYYLIIEYQAGSFSEELMEEFLGQNYKVAVFDREGTPLVWPFDTEKLQNFTARTQKFSSNGVQYSVEKTGIEETALDLYFFFKEHHFDTYRILTVFFLLGGLYFCAYQFLVEFWNAHSAKSYFDNIDFEIFNYLKEGIIIANKFNRVIFTNKATLDFFPEKEITPRESRLKDILGQAGEKNTKYTLRKYNRALEIIRSPLIKNGKLLGSLVVISEEVEDEKLYSYLFTRTIDLLSEGVMFIDRNNELNRANLMASYYLGKLEKGMHISEINPELARAIEEYRDQTAPGRVKLSLQDIFCEVLPVYNEKGVYTGTLVFIKTTSEYRQNV